MFFHVFLLVMARKAALNFDDLELFESDVADVGGVETSALEDSFDRTFCEDVDDVSAVVAFGLGAKFGGCNMTLRSSMAVSFLVELLAGRPASSARIFARRALPCERPFLCPPFCTMLLECRSS